MEPHPIGTWLVGQVFPLWSGHGVDRSTGLVWEALVHDGSPFQQMPGRLRVQARQAFCFASGAALEPQVSELAETARNPATSPAPSSDTNGKPILESR